MKQLSKLKRRYSINPKSVIEIDNITYVKVEVTCNQTGVSDIYNYSSEWGVAEPSKGYFNSVMIGDEEMHILITSFIENEIMSRVEPLVIS